MPKPKPRARPSHNRDVIDLADVAGGQVAGALSRFVRKAGSRGLPIEVIATIAAQGAGAALAELAQQARAYQGARYTRTDSKAAFRALAALTRAYGLARLDAQADELECIMKDMPPPAESC